MKNLPHTIIKKSKKWYYDTSNGQYVHVDNLKTYVEQKKQLKLVI